MSWSGNKRTSKYVLHSITVCGVSDRRFMLNVSPTMFFTDIIVTCVLRLMDLLLSHPFIFYEKECPPHQRSPMCCFNAVLCSALSGVRCDLNIRDLHLLPTVNVRF